jgi:alpha-L-rhamnosidase
MLSVGRTLLLLSSTFSVVGARWLQYGDRSVITRNWDAMEKYMKCIEDANPNYLRTQKLGPNFADWLAPDQNTNKQLIATAYWRSLPARCRRWLRQSAMRMPQRRYAELYNRARLQADRGKR